MSYLYELTYKSQSQPLLWLHSKTKLDGMAVEIEVYTSVESIKSQFEKIEQQIKSIRRSMSATAKIRVLRN